MHIHQLRYNNEKPQTSGTHVKFIPEENATCSPDPCSLDPYSPNWSLEADDVTQLACVFGVTRLFEAVESYYNGSDDKEIWAAALIHYYLDRFSEAKVSAYSYSDIRAKDLYTLNKQIEKDAFIVHALYSLMHTVLDDDKYDFCLVALIFMDMLRRKENK